jgi:hypothetical protein
MRSTMSRCRMRKQGESDIAFGICHAHMQRGVHMDDVARLAWTRGDIPTGPSASGDSVHLRCTIVRHLNRRGGNVYRCVNQRFIVRIDANVILPVSRKCTDTRHNSSRRKVSSVEKVTGSCIICIPYALMLTQCCETLIVAGGLPLALIEG